MKDLVNRSKWIIKCCTQFKSAAVKILCVLYLHLSNRKGFLCLHSLI